MNQLERLQHLETRHDLSDFDDEPADTTADDLPAGPVTAEFDKAEFAACLSDEGKAELAGWHGDESTTLAKRDTSSDFIKNRYSLSGGFGSAAGMAIARTEETVAPSGDRWEREYAADGSLIRARVTNADGGELAKAAEAVEVEIRQLADGDSWKNTFRDGELVEMELCYANGKTERFDGEGNPLE